MRFHTLASLLLVVPIGAAGAQSTTPDTTAKAVRRTWPQATVAIDVSLGQTRVKFSRFNADAGSPSTESVGLEAGAWLRPWMLVGAEARAHLTLDISPSVPSVRLVHPVIALRLREGTPVLRIATGPTWVVPPSRHPQVTQGYSATIDVPVRSRDVRPSLVLFVRYAGTATLSTPSLYSETYRVRQIAVGARLGVLHSSP